MIFYFVMVNHHDKSPFWFLFCYGKYGKSPLNNNFENIFLPFPKYLKQIQVNTSKHVTAFFRDVFVAEEMNLFQRKFGSDNPIAR